MDTTGRSRLVACALIAVGVVILAACGGSDPSNQAGRGTTAVAVDDTGARGPGTSPSSSSSSSSSSTSISSPSTPVDPALSFVPVPFRTASLDDADRLREILDASGITVNPYFDSCIAIEFTGWNPDQGDIDVFVFQSGSSPCPGDSLSRFYAIRNSAVVVEAAACGDCEPGVGPDSERYLTIRRALEGKPAVHGIVGGGARWGFDALEEIVLGSPTTTSPATGSEVPASEYATANWGGGMAPIDGAAFSSPSGNIICILSGGSATCGITEHDWTLPEQDCGEISFIPEYIGVSSRGVEKGMCVGGIETPVDARVLPYGSSLERDGVECSSAENGVTCTHVASRHGFTVSRAKLDAFG